VNQALADRYWPGGDALGKRITVRKSAQGRPEFGQPVRATIVGVVGNVRHYSLDTDFVPEVYLPYTVTVWGWMSLVVRTGADPAALVSAVARAARSVEPDLPLEGASFLNRVYDLPDSLRQSLAYRRFVTGLLGAFALPALLLAALGIYGVVSYLVAQRDREIGIRMALGARRADVLALVLGEGMRLAGLGVLLGTLGAIATTRWLSSELYETSATDPLTFVLAAVVLAGISLCATLLPARRATAIDPARALQSE
jgi:predicted lysophospholipase L1 biosynthesis ABC-type transport system permease subunit